MWRITTAAVLALAATAVPARADRQGPLLISAAISLSEALAACGEAFRARTGVALRLNFAASNVLARQIVQGAPVDVFVSADERQMDVVAGAGLVDPRSRRVVAGNRLVVAVRGGAPRWTDLTPLTSPSVRRIAVGDPQAVPAGVYAERWLRAAGLLPAVAAKLLPGASVRAALVAVRRGAVDAAIVYRTDVRAVEDVSVAFEVEGPHAPAIAYPAAVVLSSTHGADARRFVEFLTGGEAQGVLRRHGFLPPS